MKTSTAVGLSILGVAVVGAAGAVVYVLTRKETAPSSSAPHVVYQQGPTAVGPENAAKPPAVKEPSFWDVFLGIGGTWACEKYANDPTNKAACLQAVAAGQRFV